MLSLQTLSNFYCFLQDSPVVVHEKINEHFHSIFAIKLLTLIPPKKDWNVILLKLD